MKQLGLFIYIFLIGLLSGCQSETIPSASPDLVGTISTRGSNELASLPSGSQALFSTSTGTKIFTFDGNNWNGDQSIFSNSSTTLTAIYPAYNGSDMITTNPYTANGLEDILIAQSTCTNGQDIELTFKHLFSKLTIHILSPLKETVTAISLQVPKIERLNTDGSFSISDFYQYNSDINEEGNYTFIIPSVESCNLILNITIGEETVSHPLTHTFLSGYKYECNVTDRKEPGIYDADDWIDFSKAYNNGGDLSAFGKLQDDEKWLFQLWEDIDFSGINTDELQPVGYGTDKRFNDIFDGQGHNISNINIKHSGSVTGIFGRVDQYGTVKNLHLINCSTPIILSGTSSTGVGFITGTLSGTISNCSVTLGSSTVESAASTGGLVGAAYTGSNIINCFVQNTNLKSSGYVGGIVGSITEGNITNCYSASNTITRKSSYSGGFCGYAESSSITNCYVFNQTLTTTINRGQFIGYGTTSSVSNCYTDTGSPKLIFIDNDNCTTSSNKIYNSSFIVESLNKSIWQLLGEWVTEQNKDTYTLWTKDETGNLPAIFQ